MPNLLKKDSKKIIQTFESIRDHSLLKIQEMVIGGEITESEGKAFCSFCINANVAAKTYLTADNLPYSKIKKAKDMVNILDSYYFLCAVELHSFFIRLKNNKEIKKIFDMSQEKIVKNFAKIFDEKEVLEEYLKDSLNLFDKTVKEIRGDLRDLWYNQALLFGDKLSEGKIDFGDLIEKDLAARMLVSIMSQNLQIESAKFFDSIVFNKDDSK